ncbi:MAG TPA: acyltransferase family protein [Candidatus Saccharimonadales bacterium]|nr:acyltransferase family protein [Candidatus Saccharimonadales bacterium]
MNTIARSAATLAAARRSCSRTSPRSKEAARSPGLDAVRALACAMVFACHLSEYQSNGALIPLKNGVLLFFVLSGYLLYRPFVRGSVDLRRYAIHRASRILPAYVVALVGLTILTGDATFRSQPLTYLLFAQNFDRNLWFREPAVMSRAANPRAIAKARVAVSNQ